MIESLLLSCYVNVLLIFTFRYLLRTGKSDEILKSGFPFICTNQSVSLKHDIMSTFDERFTLFPSDFHWYTNPSLQWIKDNNKVDCPYLKKKNIYIFQVPLVRIEDIIVAIFGKLDKNIRIQKYKLACTCTLAIAVIIMIFYMLCSFAL